MEVEETEIAGDRVTVKTHPQLKVFLKNGLGMLVHNAERFARTCSFLLCAIKDYKVNAVCPSDTFLLYSS